MSTTIQEIEDLLLLLVPRTSKPKKLATKHSSSKHSSSSTHSSSKPTTVKIPKYEKPFSRFTAEPLKPPLIVTTTEKRDTHKAFVAAYLTINPQYVYKYCTNSKYFKKRQYFFLNTKKNITLVVTFDEIADTIGRAEMRELQLEDLLYI
jgi:hypothetical protein